MDVATLILLGGAGGLLRGALDVYTRFMDWQADRRAHRREVPGPGGEPPRFATYFDPIADPVAAMVHSLMGAGAAVLFGITGQISGAYAALVVGLSAPMLLTQLGRIQTVSDAMTGGSQAADAAPVEPVGTAQPAGQPQTVHPTQATLPQGAADGAPNASFPSVQSAGIGTQTADRASDQAVTQQMRAVYERGQGHGE